MKDTNKKALIGILAGVAAVVLVVALMLIENSMGGKLIITNNTDRNIESILVHFYDEVQEMEVDYLYECNVNAGEKEVYKYEGYYDFTDLCCYFCADVTFEGEDTIYVFDGEFDGPFKGSFKMKFYIDENNDYCASLKATEGLFGSIASTGLDSNIVFYFDDSDWDYID